MKKILFFSMFLFISFSKLLYSIDFSWDLITAFSRNNFEAVENVIRSNITTMSESDKRIVMNIAINHSSGENALRALELLSRYNIRPTSFDLFTAINRNRQNNAIQFILQNGVAPNGEILLLVMERQRFDLARQFIEMGVNVNFQYPLSRHDADGMTPLLYASRWGNIEMVRLLLEHGANINAQAINGDTALSIARANNNEAILNHLLEHGATESVDIPNNQIFIFQAGSYRLFGENRILRFTGNRNSGNVAFVNETTNRTINGFYRVVGNDLTVILEEFTFNYRLDSNTSFSGNGETWIRIGN